MFNTNLNENEKSLLRNLEDSVRAIISYYCSEPETKEEFAKNVRWVISDFPIPCLHGK